MKHLLIALAVLLVTGLLVACTGVQVSIDRQGCSTDRTVEVTRSAGEPERTTVRARRVCGEPVTPAPGDRVQLR